MAPWREKAKTALVWVVPCLFWADVTGCATPGEPGTMPSVPVVLPYLRMETGECYFIDDFLPTPENLVTGRVGGLFTRYYTYGSASYKEWTSQRIMLSFFSKDSRCWTLFEEYAFTNL